METDRLIGVADVAAITGSPQRTVGEWRARRKIIPDTEVRVDARGTLIWRASTVLGALRDAGVYTGPVPDAMPLPDMVSVAHIMDRTGKDRRGVQWMMTDKAGTRLPEPTERVSGAPLWPREQIDAWLAEHFTKEPA